MWKRCRKLLALLILALLVAGLASTFPPDLALLGAIDFASYLDVLIGVYLVTTVTKVGPLLQAARQFARRWFRLGRPRQKRQPRSASTLAVPSPDNDDDPARFILFAA
jgi:hypothetical protein